MNTNEVRWKLHNYHTDIKRIQQLKDDLKEYRLMDGVGSQVISGMPSSHSNSSCVEKAGDRLDYIRSMENDLDSLMRVKRAIDYVYMYLKEPARTIIDMRYFLMPKPDDVRQSKYNWLEISEAVKYNEDYCKQIDGKVVLQIQNKLHEITHF